MALHRAVRSRWARFWALAAVAGMVITASLVFTPAASADTGCPPNGGHCYSVGLLYRNDFTGIYGHWHNNNMYLDNYSGSQHINSEMWLSVGSTAWVETGLTNADTSSDPNPCGCTAYQVFWDDVSASGNYYAHFIANTVPDGTDHWYMIVRGSSANQWNVYYDGYLQGVSTVTGAWTGTRQAIGGELATNSMSNAHMDWFQMTAEFRDGAGNWYTSNGGASNPTDQVDPGFTGYWAGTNNSDWVWWKN